MQITGWIWAQIDPCWADRTTTWLCIRFDCWMILKKCCGNNRTSDAQPPAKRLEKGCSHWVISERMKPSGWSIYSVDVDGCVLFESTWWAHRIISTAPPICKRWRMKLSRRTRSHLDDIRRSHCHWVNDYACIRLNVKSLFCHNKEVVNAKILIVKSEKN